MCVCCYFLCIQIRYSFMWCVCVCVMWVQLSLYAWVVGCVCGWYSSGFLDASGVLLVIAWPVVVACLLVGLRVCFSVNAANPWNTHSICVRVCVCVQINTLAGHACVHAKHRTKVCEQLKPNDIVFVDKISRGSPDAQPVQPTAADRKIGRGALAHAHVQTHTHTHATSNHAAKHTTVSPQFGVLALSLCGAHQKHQLIYEQFG